MAWYEHSGNDVVLLGAGFSKAVSTHFPTLEELGALALERAEIPESERPSSLTNFETWLTQKSTPQPYLSVKEALESNRAAAAAMDAVAEVLSERQAAALLYGLPEWLDDLLSTLHANEATVLSSNYDNILEAAIDTRRLIDRASHSANGPHISSHDIVDRMPPLPSAILQEEATEQERNGRPHRHESAATIRLLKLHGSLSWYIGPHDTTGITLNRWRVPSAAVEHIEEDEGARRRLLPGRHKFLIPPTGTLEGSNDNLVVREIWTRARKSLLDATRLIVIGYSLPASDQAISGLLAATLGGRGIELVVVDPHARDLTARLTDLGISFKRTKLFDGPACVEMFTRWYRDERAREVVNGLLLLAKDIGLAKDEIPSEGSHPLTAPPRGEIDVDWGYGESYYRTVIDMDRPGETYEGGDLVLHTKSVPKGAPPDHSQLLKLLRILVERPVKRLLLPLEGGGRFPVVDYFISDDPRTAEGSEVNLALVPSGRHLS